MIITAIQEEDRKKSRIVIDGELYCLLYKGEIRRLSIQEGMECSEEWLRDLDEKVLIPRARNYAAHLMEQQDRTEQQILRKLTDHHYPDHVAAAAVAIWKDYGYINDGKYAENYFYFHHEQESYRKMTEKLRLKGISQSVIESEWEKFCADQEESGESADQTALMHAIEKKGRTLDIHDPDQKNKMIRFLLGRGFTYQEILKALDSLTE